jgi:hypothetical protein
MICRALAQIFDAAVLDGLLQANPARGKPMAIKLPKPSRTWLERDEVLSLLDAAAELEAEDAEPSTRSPRASNSSRPRA